MNEVAPSNREVFIVDDDPAIREVLALVFTRAGYHPTCFAEGNSLLASARMLTPACIVLDVNIPGRSGLDILRQLNAQDYPAPIFVMSGQGDIPMAARVSTIPRSSDSRDSGFERAATLSSTGHRHEADGRG
jgi:FixJ family two-component response regulator